MSDKSKAKRSSLKQPKPKPRSSSLSLTRRKKTQSPTQRKPTQKTPPTRKTKRSSSPPPLQTNRYDRERESERIYKNQLSSLKTSNLEGPMGMIEMFRPADGKHIYFFHDIHTSQYKNCKATFPKTKFLSMETFVTYVLGVESHDHPEFMVDVFVEAPFVNKPGSDFETSNSWFYGLTVKDQGYLFGSLAPYFFKQGCLELDKTVCHQNYPNARFHYADIRQSSIFLNLIYIYYNTVKKYLRPFLDAMLAKQGPFTLNSILEMTQTIITYRTLINDLYQQIETQCNCLMKDLTMNHLIRASKILKQFPNFDAKAIENLLYTMMINELNFDDSVTTKNSLKFPSSKVPWKDNIDFQADKASLDLPLYELQTILLQIESLVSSYSNDLQYLTNVQRTKYYNEYPKKIAQLTIQLRPLILKANSLWFIVMAKVAYIMDLYTIGRLLKSYVQHAMVFEGGSHVQRQVAALKTLGFVVVENGNTTPKHFDRWIHISNDVKKKLATFAQLPPDNIEMFKRITTSRGEHGVIFADKTGQVYKQKTPIFNASQCLSMKHVKFPLFNKPSIAK